MKAFLPLLVVAAAPSSAGQPVTAHGLSWMHGEWQGAGQLFGRPSRVTLSIAPALEGRATILTYRAQVAAADSQPSIRFEARATYRLDGRNRIIGRWNDSAGNDHPVGGQVTGAAMTTLWGETRTEIGRSSYGLAPDGSLTVTDSVLQPDGSWRVFATASYRRVS
jgi:hypothetical protein